MALVTKENGNITRRQEKASSSTQTATYTMVTGIITKQMDTVSIRTSVGLATKAIGRMINSTVTVLRIGQKERDMKVNTTCPRKKEQANIPTQMVQRMKVSGLTIKSMALEATSGQTDASIMASGKRTTCTDLASIFMRTT